MPKLQENLETQKKDSKEKSRLEQEKTQENIQKKTILAFIATLIYSAALWILIILKAAAEVALKNIFFPIFAAFGVLNTSLAVHKAYASPDQKIIKWTDAISGVIQTILIGLGVVAPFIGGAIGAFLVAVQPWLFVAAISLWVAHDLARAIYHGITYFRLWLKNLAETPEAQQHKATANAAIKSALVGAATLVAMIAMLGLVLALISNPITGPIVVAFSAALAIYLAVQYITTYTERGREWAKIWNEKYPRIVKAWHFICHPLNTIGKFIRQQWASYKAKKEPTPASKTTPPSSQSAAITAPPLSPMFVSEQSTPSQNLSQEQTKTLQEISPFFKHRYADEVRKAETSQDALTYLRGIINQKKLALEAKVQTTTERSKPGSFGYYRKIVGLFFWRSERKEDKLNFLTNLENYILFFSSDTPNTTEMITYIAYKELGFSEKGFESFMTDQAHRHPDFDRADFGISEVNTIAQAAKILLARIKEDQETRSHAPTASPS